MDIKKLKKLAELASDSIEESQFYSEVITALSELETSRNNLREDVRRLCVEFGVIDGAAEDE
jgi:hypothetical protein